MTFTLIRPTPYLCAAVLPRRRRGSVQSGLDRVRDARNDMEQSIEGRRRHLYVLKHLVPLSRSPDPGSRSLPGWAADCGCTRHGILNAMHGTEILTISAVVAGGTGKVSGGNVDVGKINVEACVVVGAVLRREIALDRHPPPGDANGELAVVAS